MNNHRNNNNRRRGRGNRQQGGGGNQSNRIDSRARGNAPQLLDKYKKLAQDAQHNGDRVQAEYYLQFADHYFRVIADNKARQDEQRGNRRDERDQDDDDGDNDDETGGRRQSQQRDTRNRRDDAKERRDDEGDSSDYEPAENPFKRQPRSEGRPPRAEPRKPRTRKPREDAQAASGGEIDAAALPPSIADAGEDEAPKKKRAPRARKASPDGEEAVRAVG